MTDSFAYRFSDKRFSALGFGARIPPNYEVRISVCIPDLPLCSSVLNTVLVRPCAHTETWHFPLIWVFTLSAPNFVTCSRTQFVIQNFTFKTNYRGYIYSWAPRLKISTCLGKISCNNDIETPECWCSIYIRIHECESICLSKLDFGNRKPSVVLNRALGRCLSCEQ